MYRESEKTKQPDMWKDSRLEMGKRSREIFDNSEGWHHRFRVEVTNRVEEGLFKPLFSEGNGSPNAPIRILVAMMVLKEGLGISDEQLYEQCRFNMLIRSALGLLNSDEEVPTESTYYLFRHKIAAYMEISGKNLLEQAFSGITHGQCREYHVSGRRIRMDSKLLGSNIGWYSRYGIVHETVRKYCAANGITEIAGKEQGLMAAILKEKGEAVTYRSTKEEVEQLLAEAGILMYRLLEAEGADKKHEYALLKRVFEEQFEVYSGPGGGKKKRVKLREKTEISGRSVQNPHDAQSEYRDKGGNKVKGYSVNITETCDEWNLNLIVGVRTEGCGTADVKYLQDGLAKAQEAVSDKIEEVYTDGAYHSPENQEYCKEKNIDWVLRGIQGKPSKYDLSFDADGNMVVVNKESGERLAARKTNSRNPEALERWVIKDGEKKPIYFERKDVETCMLRKRLGEIPKERLDIRNNVEATIFQLGYHYRGDKSRYRGLMRHTIWAVSRCMWINFRRIQLWIQKAADRGNDSRLYQNCFLFFQRFLRRYRFIFCQTMFATSC
jgi:hypothetical protein